MGKARPTPPPQTDSLDIPPSPPAPPPYIERASLDIPRPEAKEQSDPEFEKVLDSIRERQWETRAKIEGLTPGDMAFGMMRNVPRKDWNKPLTELGHWPRGSSISEIKENPKLKNFTPAQAIEKLFEMDDELKKGKK